MIASFAQTMVFTPRAMLTTKSQPIMDRVGTFRAFQWLGRGIKTRRDARKAPSGINIDQAAMVLGASIVLRLVYGAEIKMRIGKGRITGLAAQNIRVNPHCPSFIQNRHYGVRSQQGMAGRKCYCGLSQQKGIVVY